MRVSLARSASRWLARRVVGPGSVLVALLIGASACTMGQARQPEAPHEPATTATRAAHAEGVDPNGTLPEVLESLGLSDAQRGQLLALEKSLRSRVEPVQDAAQEMARALATTARRCDSNVMALESAATWVEFSANQARQPVLDAIDRVHDILTPTQRKKLANRLLHQQESKSDEERADEGARALGEKLDLSLGQMFRLLTRAQALRSDVEQRIDPWRESMEKALRAFPSEDFAIRDYKIASVPVAELTTRFIRDAVRALLPILEPEQCRALADFIERAVEERERQAAREHPGA